MKTTLNIRVELLGHISRAAKTNRISCSEMIFILIKRAAADIDNPGNIGRLVRYQERRAPKAWHPFHIDVREDMYEYWQDMRKLLKMSVSFILACAVQKYLLDKPTKIIYGDNNLCKNYFIIKQVFNSVIIWKFIWGYPPHLEQLIT
jgi:hypothetical protein